MCLTPTPGLLSSIPSLPPFAHFSSSSRPAHPFPPFLPPVYVLPFWIAPMPAPSVAPVGVTLPDRARSGCIGARSRLPPTLLGGLVTRSCALGHFCGPGDGVGQGSNVLVNGTEGTYKDLPHSLPPSFSPSPFCARECLCAAARACRVVLPFVLLEDSFLVFFALPLIALSSPPPHPDTPDSDPTFLASLPLSLRPCLPRHLPPELGRSD